MVGAQQPGELRIGRAAAVEIGADSDERPARAGACAHERVDEGGTLVLIAAGGEQLLELVDGHHAGRLAGGASVECAQRVLAGAHERLRPALAAGQHARRQRGEQPRAQRGRLAAARRADDPQQRRPMSRATMSATSRSRPKKKSPSSTSKDASPLKGQ